MKKIERAMALWGRHEALLRCPACGGGMRLRERSLVCENRHCYDFSAKGYVNLANAGEAGMYDRELFEARRAVFSAGFYAPVARALSDIVAREPGIASGPNARILDAGCGEGYYLAELSGFLGLRAGVDLSREGIAAAAGRDGDALWCVADLARLPFADGTFDLIWNILTPARYGEFIRALKPGGLLVKAVPGVGYLRELRERLGARLQKESYSDEAVLAHARERMGAIETRSIAYERPVSPEEWRHFVRMTPMTAGLTPRERDALASRPAAQITIELTLALARAPREELK